MNKAELAAVISDQCGVTKKQAEEMLESLTVTITNTIKKGGEVVLTGFGTFSARVRKGRTGFNPRNTNEPITIPDTLVVKFKAGKRLKETLKEAGTETSEPIEETISDYSEPETSEME